MKTARARLMGGLHAEGLKRGMDHDAMRAAALARYGVASMVDLTEVQLGQWYHEWTGKGLKRAGKPRGAASGTEMVSGEDLARLGEEFGKRNWGPETQANFIRRQLRGRTAIRTRKDCYKVLAGVRAMNRRGTKR